MRKYWNTAIDGAFETSSNWTPAGVPGDSDLVFITAPAPAFSYTVTTSTDVTVLGVSLGINAILDVTNSKTLTAVEGTATGANLGVIQIEAGSRFVFGGVLNNQSMITSAAGALTDFFVLGDTTLKGGGNFFLSDNANNTLRGFDTLTNVDNLIEGAGRITTDIVNKTLGKIEASSGGNQLVLAFSNVTNTGMLLGGGTAGLDLDECVVTNIGGTIQANAGSFVFLENGTKVIGGQVNTISNGDIVVKNAIFDGSGTHPITHEGNLEVRSPTFTGDGLYIQGVINNQGVIAINAGGTLFLGLPSSLGMDTTLQGGGQVTLDNNSTIDLCSSTTLSKPLTLNNIDNTISGDGTIGSAATAASLVFSNGKFGVVNANVLNRALEFDCNVVNSHLMEATGGSALALFDTMVTNTNGTIRADTGSFVSVLGTIKGGRLEGAGLVVLRGGATLDGSTTALTNAGNVNFSEESFATLKGTINNTGNIEVGIPSGGTGGGTVLVLAPAGAPSQMTLTGGGTLKLDLYGVDFIDGVGGAVLTTFANVNNKIEGAGRIGDRGLILKNGGTINATGSSTDPGENRNSLVIDTGSRTVTNTGTMEATGGDLYIASPLSNTGVLIADGFSLVAAQASTGGTAKLDDSGQIEFGGPTTTAVRFDDGSLTSLVLDDSVHFKGIISNFGRFNTAQTIDLLDISFATVHMPPTFTPGSPNILTVKDGAGHTAQLKFAGSYTAANFHLTDDGHGGTLITDPPAASAATAALFGSHIAAAFPAGSNGFNGFAARYDTFTQPLLAPTPHG